MKKASIIVFFLALLGGTCIGGDTNQDLSATVIELVTRRPPDFVALRRLVENGYDINAPLYKSGGPAIVWAADTNMLSFLISLGAYPDKTDTAGWLPIDNAYYFREYEIVEYLAKNHPYTNSTELCGYPLRLLECVFPPETSENAFTTYVSLNNEQPPPALIAWIKKRRLHAVPYAINLKANTASYDGTKFTADEWRTYLRAQRTNAKIGQLIARIEKKDELTWTYSKSFSFGPLAGSIEYGKYMYVQRYKHWLFVDVDGMFE
jgi:hypothetical protein